MSTLPKNAKLKIESAGRESYKCRHRLAISP